MDALQQDYSLLPQTLSALKDRISEPRFDRYRVAARGDEQIAFRLYRWNILVSQAFYWPLSLYEIALRNAIDAAFSKTYDPDWPLKPEKIPHLQGHTRRKLADTHSRARRRHKEVSRRTRSETTPQEVEPPLKKDWIIPQLTLGVWTSFLSDSYHVTWNSCLHTSFPNRPTDRQISRLNLHRSADHIRQLRNRIMHHEPIFHRPLHDDVRCLYEMLHLMCGATAWLANTRTDLEDLLKQHPLMRQARPAFVLVR